MFQVAIEFAWKVLVGGQIAVCLGMAGFRVVQKGQHAVFFGAHGLFEQGIHHDSGRASVLELLGGVETAGKR